MNAVYSLTMEERDSILNQLSEEQRVFLADTLKRSRRTVFARHMAARKGARIPETATYEEIEHLLEDWIYVGYIDAGVRSTDLKCECGASLRYQHHVENKKDGSVLKLGIKHLEEHTLIDAKIVSQIIKGFDVLDQEQFEILVKYRDGWQLSDYFTLPLPDGFEVPKDIAGHLELGLPLLDRQVARLQESLRKFRDSRPPSTFEPAEHALPAMDALHAASQPTLSLNTDDDDPQLSFDLFDMEQPQTVPDRPADHTYPVPGLSSSLQAAVRHYLLQGIRSARVLSELLIQHHHADDSRYITEKPHIYPLVSMYIDRIMAEEGICRLVSRDHEDRLYELTDPEGDSL